MFRHGDDGRQVEVVFVCRREMSQLTKKRAARGESYSMDDLPGSPLRGHNIVRKYMYDDGSVRRTTPWTEMSTGQILHIDEPELLSYRVVIGTEAACVGLRDGYDKLLSDILTADSATEENWQSSQEPLKKIQTEPDMFDDVGDPLLYENLQGQVMAIMKSDGAKQTWAKAYIKHVGEDGLFKVKFDEYNMKRENVPLTEILPIPEELMKLPCWLFKDIPGEGC